MAPFKFLALAVTVQRFTVTAAQTHSPPGRDRASGVQVGRDAAAHGPGRPGGAGWRAPRLSESEPFTACGSPALDSGSESVAHSPGDS